MNSRFSTRFITRSAIVNVMAGAAAKATRGLIRDFGEVENLQVSQKGTGDFVSAADLRVEKILHAELNKAYPDYGFLMEEGGAIAGKNPSCRWIIDPLDGTKNFLHGIPHFAITIALEKDDEIVAGMTYDPIKDEFFWAEKGMGAFLNDRRIRISKRHALKESLVVTSARYTDYKNPQKHVDMLAKVMPKISGSRRMGSAALDLAYVAAGRFESYWEAAINPWDVAAGIILVKEAGGKVTNMKGENNIFETSCIVATNGLVHDAMLKALNE